MEGKEITSTKLGEFVRTKRQANGLSLAQAERRSGVDVSYWSRLELGETRSPNPRHLAAIARTIDVPIQELYGLAGYYLPDALPSLAPYLRNKYGLEAEAVAQLHAVFEQIRGQTDADDRKAA